MERVLLVVTPTIPEGRVAFDENRMQNALGVNMYAATPKFHAPAAY